MLGLLGSFFYLGAVISSSFLSHTHTAESIILGNEQGYLVTLGLIFISGSYKKLQNSQINIDYLLKDLVFASLTKGVIAGFFLSNYFQWPLPTTLLGLYLLFMLIEVFYEPVKSIIIKLLGWEANDDRSLK